MTNALQEQPREPTCRRANRRHKTWTPERRARQAALIRAHRTWRHSTGPRTETGKARAALNAITHGRTTSANLTRLRRIRDALRLAAHNLTRLKLALGPRFARTRGLVLALSRATRSKLASVCSNKECVMPLDQSGGNGDGGGGNGPRRSLNVLGGELALCSNKPMTGFFRNGCCDTSRQDVGSHTVCVVMTAEFLAFSKAQGNDLSTPMPDYGFPGLKPGDRWCLCAPRWQEALEAGQAPRVVLRATEATALGHCTLADLKRHAIDLM